MDPTTMERELTKLQDQIKQLGLLAITGTIHPAEFIRLKNRIIQRVNSLTYTPTNPMVDPFESPC